MSETLIIYIQEMYKQFDRVPMVSPLGPTISSVLLCYHEHIWPQNCPSTFNPVIYTGYIDVTFLLFCSKHHISFKSI